MKFGAYACMAIGLCLTGTASAAPAEEGGKPCLMLSQVESANLLGDRALVVKDYRGQTFLVHINGWCHDLSWHNVNNISANPNCLHSGDWLPSDGGSQPFTDGAPVISGRRGGATRCIVSKVEFYTKEQEAADRAAGK